MIIAVPTGIKIFSWLLYPFSKVNMTSIISILYFITNRSRAAFYTHFFLFTRSALRGVGARLEFMNTLILRASLPHYSAPFSSYCVAPFSCRGGLPVLVCSFGPRPVRFFSTKGLRCGVYKKFSKSNWYYLPPNVSNTELVIYGSNLCSTVGYPKVTEIIRHTVNIPLNLRSILVGILISDAWMQINKGGNSRLAFKQSLDHFEYFFFIYSKFSHYCSAPFKLSKTSLPARPAGARAKTFYAVYFSTRSYPCFTEFYFLFYKNKVKVVPHNLYDLLTYESLAHWIMCDGTKSYNTIVLQTQSFDIQQVVFILNVLLIKFDIHSTINFQRNQPVLYIKTSSFKKLLPKILPYFVDSLKYKILN